MENEENAHGDDYFVPSSPTIITKYAHKSSSLIYSIEKHIFIVIGVVGALAAVAVINVLEVLNITNLIPENFDDTVVALLSLASLAAMVPILRLSILSKRILGEWAEMFERNSIKNSISMSLDALTRERVVFAVAESVEEAGEALSGYIAKGSFQEFFDVKVGTASSFDVLIDSETVNPDKGEDLKRILSSFGAIIIKIVDGPVGRSEVESFSNSLLEYSAAMKKKKDGIGLAIVVGREVLPEASIAVKAGKRLVKDLLLIEKL